MAQEFIWHDGLDNYRCHQIQLDQKNINYNCHLSSQPNSTLDIVENIDEILHKFSYRKIELLYSGGLDSEFLLLMFIKSKYPVIAVTMKLVCRGYVVNTHDLYYSEKFCRDHGIEQKFIELDIEQFFESGRYLDYLLKYHIQEPHVATHFWMFEQCQNFPVLAGEYSWPWVSQPLISPHRLEYSCYDRYLFDNGISGIGNFLNYSYSMNYSMMGFHLQLARENSIEINARNLPIFKKTLYSLIAGHDFQVRMRSYGWENLPRSVFNKNIYKLELIKKIGKLCRSTISWQVDLAELLGGSIYHNDRYS